MAHLQNGIKTQPPSPATRDRYHTNKQDLEWREEQARHDYHNVGEIERVASALIGGGLLFKSLFRPSWRSGIMAVIGAAFLHRGISGHCAVYRTLMGPQDQMGDPSTASLGRRKVHTDRATKVQESTMIERTAEDLYRFWRHLPNLAKVMSHLQSVEVINDRLSHWVVQGLPGGPSLEWDAEIINEVPNERIGWRTLRASDVDHAGSVEFAPTNDGTLTRVTVTLQYDPPAGPVGAAIANMLGQDPGQKIATDLRRFKEMMETEAHSSR